VSRIAQQESELFGFLATLSSAYEWRKLTSSPEGQQAVEQLDSVSLPPVEFLRALLVAALQSDRYFENELSRLIVTGSGHQVVDGDGNKVAKLDGSTNVSISIS
jgi:hypothetical protein